MGFREQARKSDMRTGFLARLQREAQCSPQDLKGHLRRGLTLVELAIVLLVLGIIMGIVYSGLDFSALDKAKVLGVKNSSRKLKAYLEIYEAENSRLEEMQPLTAIVGKAPVDEEGVQDPWGNPYFLCSDEEGQRQICSYGADGEQGGEGENEDFYLTEKSSWPPWLSGKTEGEEEDG